MPRYFFDLHNDVDVLDEEGKELPNLEAAKAEALREVREMLQASITDSGTINLRHHIDVRDETGRIMHVIHFEDVVTVQRGDEVLSRASASAGR